MKAVRIVLKIVGVAVLGLLIFFVMAVVAVQPPSYQNWPHKKDEEVFKGIRWVEFADIPVPYDKNGRALSMNRVEELRNVADNKLHSLDWSYVKWDEAGRIIYFRSVGYFQGPLGIKWPTLLYERIRVDENSSIGTYHLFYNYSYFATIMKK